MSCFEEEVKYAWRRVIILLSLELKALEILHSINKSG